MIEVKLETASHELVGYTLIPPFIQMPDVLILGDRTFRHYEMHYEVQQDDRKLLHIYRECFAVAVVNEVKDKPYGEENAATAAGT